MSEVLKFAEWFYSAKHREKYLVTDPAFLAAWEAWEEQNRRQQVPEGMVAVDLGQLMALRAEVSADNSLAFERITAILAASMSRAMLAAPSQEEAK